MLRLIREVDPPTPSNRISASDTLATLAATRHIEPARLGRFVRGELDWIVMKALAKERQRRYESPISFAHDIERFLTHEPVSAGPPTAWYRLRKFIRRNRVQVIAASVVLMALVGGIVGTTLGLVEAKRQRIIALDAAYKMIAPCARKPSSGSRPRSGSPRSRRPTTSSARSSSISTRRKPKRRVSPS